jgi:MFS family permease
MILYRPLGIAATIGAFSNGRLLDWNYQRTAKKLGLTVDKKRGDDLRNFPIERARLQTVFLFQGLQVIVYPAYGWALQKHAPLAVPLILQFILGFCLVVVSNSLSTLLSDIFPGNVSTASAASNLVRCLLGAVGAATVDDMLRAMGLGWAFVFLGLVLAAASGFLWVELMWGMGWRQERWIKAEEKKQAEEEEGEEKRAQGESARDAKT